MKVNEIRPDELVIKQQKFLDADIGWLLTHKDKFVTVNCPCCGGNTNYLKFEKNRFTYLECKECATYFMSPRPTPELLNEFYKESKNYKFWAEEMFPASEEKRHDISLRRVEIIEKLLEKFNDENIRILEVGPGYGTFSKTFKERNPKAKVKAVEPSNSLANICKEAGVDVYHGTIENFSKNVSEKFDAIVCFEVIEHVFDPVKMLTSFFDSLKKDGLVIFTCPNGMGFDIQILQEKSDTVDHEHLNYFNPRSIDKLIRRAGLEPVANSTVGELDVNIVRKEFEASKVDLGQDKFLRYYFSTTTHEIDHHFQTFVKNSGLSSNLMVVAKK